MIYLFIYLFIDVYNFFFILRSDKRNWKELWVFNAVSGKRASQMRLQRTMGKLLWVMLLIKVWKEHNDTFDVTHNFVTHSPYAVAGVKTFERIFIKSVTRTNLK